MLLNKHDLFQVQ